MPKLITPLTEAQLRKIAAENGADSFNAIAVGGVPGLTLRLDGKTGASWILRYAYGGKRHALGLGSYPLVSLIEARDVAAEKLRELRKGVSPHDTKQQIKAAAEEAVASGKTFKQAALEEIERRDGGWSNSKHAQQWTNTLTTYAFPLIGNMYCRDIQTADVMRVLKPIWVEKHVTAKRVRQRIEAALNYAKSKGWRSGDNPAALKGNLEALLPVVNYEEENHAAMPHPEVKDFMQWLTLNKRARVAAMALRFCILATVRSENIYGATWQEIDLEEATWTIPKERMKAREIHYVPLSAQAVELLREVKAMVEAEGYSTEGEALVFPSIFYGGKGGKLSMGAMLQLCKQYCGDDAVPHGFRSSFRDWGVDETNYSKELIRKCLAHTVEDKVDGAYQRSDAFKRRIPIMQEWADYVLPTTAAKKQAPQQEAVTT